MKVKSHLKGLVPYPPGKTVEEIRRELGMSGKIYKFNSNENPLGTSPLVKRVVSELAESVHLYPEASYIELKQEIAKLWGVEPEQVVVGNGSDEVIELVFKAIVDKDDEIVITEPSFLMYEKFAEIYGAKTKKVKLKNFSHDLEGILSAVSENTKVVFIDHPHNPTGTVIKRSRWKEFLKALPRHVLLVIDEAYADFIEEKDTPKGIEFLQERRECLVIRTFSKSYGLAGLRLGYGIGEKDFVKVLDSIRQPFNVNLVAAKAGVVALKDEEFLENTRKTIFEGRNYLTQELNNMGFEVIPSQANFIMVNFGNKAKFVYESLMKRGVLVRPLGAYGFSEWIRISIGLPDENQHLVKTLKEVLSEDES